MTQLRIMKRLKLIASVISLPILLALAACGGGGGGGSSGGGVGGGGGGGSAPATAATAALTLVSVKTFRFSWTDVADATHYKLFENPDGVSGFTQTGSDIPQGRQVVNHTVPLYARINAQYILQSCNAVGCTDASTVSVSGTLVAGIGYVKASNTDAGDQFGISVALSADGNTLAVGTPFEESNAKGVGGDQTNDDAGAAGAAYVFTRSGTTWAQQAYVKASNTEANDLFGISLALSADGNTLAVGADEEDSAAKGVGGDQTNNDAGGAGAVYVFTRSGTTWAQQAYVKASNTDENDQFGTAVSLSADGNTLAVGARNEASNATGVNTGQDNNDAADSGAVYVFTHSGINWAQQAYIKASNTDAGDQFGISVAFSADGNILAVGARLEFSNATGIDKDQMNNDASNAGAAYVFTRSVIVGVGWGQEAYVKASNTDAGDQFGISVALSADGNTLAVGAIGEGDNLAPGAGAVYIFTHFSISLARGTWSQQAYVKASNTDAGDLFGQTVSLSGDGNTLAVGAFTERSNAMGIGDDEADNNAPGAGAAYVFTRSGTTWAQQAYVKASNTEANDLFGISLALSADGNTLAVGALGEDSIAGAVYLY